MLNKMAANKGKFYDRSPIICAAGKPIGDPTQTVSSCLNDYRLESQVTALKHDAGIFEEHRKPFIYKLPKLKNIAHRGIYTESRECLQSPVQTRYQTLINDLKDTSYESYWNKVVGKPRDPIPGIPAGMDTVTTTYGRPLLRSLTAKECINPPKTPYQVLWDSQVGHDMYKKTHNDYNAGEQRDRSYLQPAFSSDRRYGFRTTYDPRGIWARCATHWYNDKPVSSAKDIQANVIERKQPRVSKVFAPNNNIELIPKGHRFGDLTVRPMYGVEELLRDPECYPCTFKRDLYEWFKYLNQLRMYMKKRFNNFGFDFKEFENRNRYFDKECTGMVPLELFYSLCRCHDVKYDFQCLEPFFRFSGVIDDNDQINYRDFIYLIDINKSVPEIIKLDDVPVNCQHYVSTSMAAAKDYLEVDNSSKLSLKRFPIFSTQVAVAKNKLLNLKSNISK